MATRQATPPDGSRTITAEENQSQEEEQTDGTSVGTLRLRGLGRHHQRVIWREDVVDNEGAGKKSSKVCCIYHKPRQFDESSSSDESSDEDSGSEDNGRARRRCKHDHDHDHDHDSHAHPDAGHGTVSRDGEGGVVHELQSDSDDTNAYERMPRRKPKKGKNPAHNKS